MNPAQIHYLSIQHRGKHFSIPLNPEGNLNLSLLKRYFPRALGLTFENGGRLCIVDIRDNALQIPEHDNTYDVHTNVGSEGESNGFDIPGKIIEPASDLPNPKPNSKIRRRENTDFHGESQQEIAEIGDSVDQITKAKNIMEMIRAAKQPKPSREIKSVPSRMPKSSRPTNLPHKKSSHSTVHVGWLHRTIDGDNAVRHTQIKMPAGGIRHLQLNRDEEYSVDDIIRFAKDKFFSGKSIICPVGEISNLDLALGHHNGDLIEEFVDSDGCRSDLWSHFKAIGVPTYRYNMYLITSVKSKSAGEQLEHTGGSDIAENLQPNESSKITRKNMRIVSMMEKTDIPAGSKSHANVMDNPMPNSMPAGLPSIVEDPPSSDSPAEPKFVVTYYDVKVSKYTNVPSITEKTRRELYDDLLLENVEENTSYSEFDPIDYGHKICRIEKDGQTLLDVEIDTDLKRQITFPNSVEPIPQHSILFDVPELHGYTDKDSYGIGLISSCTDECKATYTWYRGGNMVKRGQSLYWIATAGDGLFSCDVECHASING